MPSNSHRLLPNRNLYSYWYVYGYTFKLFNIVKTLAPRRRFLTYDNRASFLIHIDDMSKYWKTFSCDKKNILTIVSLIPRKRLAFRAYLHCNWKTTILRVMFKSNTKYQVIGYDTFPFSVLVHN